MLTATDICGASNPLAGHYSRFEVDRRLLLTGHSHQAWPDCGYQAQKRAWEDAARLVDDKWAVAFEKADRVRAGFARLLGDDSGEIALGVNTHELVVRFLSALPLCQRPRLVTTDAEFHSLRRQLDRLSETSVEIVRVAAKPVQTVGERLAKAVDDRVVAVATSCVFFDSGQIAGDLEPLVSACAHYGAELLIDAYHALNVAPFSIDKMGLSGAFVVGGGYKYCQLGEGNCFLRFPKDCAMRPVVTGWFAEFEHLDAIRSANAEVPYGSGHLRFAGSTYDPTSHYRAEAVFDFFERMGLNPRLLREVSRHQIGLLARTFDDLDLPDEVITRDRSVPLEQIAGFLVLHSAKASQICKELARLGVRTDARGTSLRFGPAPYLNDDQLVRSVSALKEAVVLKGSGPSVDDARPTGL